MPNLLEELVRNQVADLGRRIRDLRGRHGWTLDELARRAEVSKSYLSRIEEGDRQPSVATLLSIASAFGVPLPALFEDDRQDGDCTVIRGVETPVHDGNGLLYSTLSGAGKRYAMQPIRVTVPGDRADGELYSHDGEEWLYVLRGRLRLIVGDRTHDLHAGDAAHFDARSPHRLMALDGGDVDLILVACTAPKQLLSSYK